MVSLEGERLRRFFELPLTQNQNPGLALSWTLYHVIDENSPLYQIDADGLAELKAALGVVVSGYDVVAAQTILGRKAYEYSEIRFGHRYADIISTSEDGRLRIDYGKFHETLEG